MKKILERFKFKGALPSVPEGIQEADNQATISEKQGDNRRDFIKKATLGGLFLGMKYDTQPEKEMEYVTQKVRRSSAPSDLKITDLRVAVIAGAPMTCPILRIDTNQGISGYGEIRDGASAKYGLFLKSRLLGKNPCNVESIFKVIKQFGQILFG